MWVLPPNLPAFCSSSVILGTVGDLMPIPQSCHQQNIVRPSIPSHRGKLPDSDPWGKSGLLSHTDLVKTWANRMAV